MSRYTPLIQAVLSGLLLFLSFPKFGFGLFAWIALVPLLYAVKEKNESQAMRLGFISGFIFNVGLIYWVTFAIVKYGNMPIYAGIAAMLLLASYLALYTALFSGGISYLTRKKVPIVASGPILWTSLEYAKAHLFTGFPWENLAYSQYANLNIIQISDITGYYGVTFLIVFVNSVIFDVVIAKSSLKNKILKVGSTAVLIAAIAGYGIYRADFVNRAMAKSPSIDVDLIQGNIDQGIKWDDHYRNETMMIYQSLSNRIEIPEGLTIWPETAVPYYFQDLDNNHRNIIEIAKSTNRWLLIGSPSYTKKAIGSTYGNSAFLISPKGEITGKYDKIHLVPFGEYVPLRSLFPFMEKIVAGIGDFEAGTNYEPLAFKDVKMGVMICYEGIFPEPVKKYKRREANLLVNITNDAWYGRTSAPYQHMSMSVFRAIEGRLFLARAANTGISAIVDATGKIVSQTGLYERTTLKGKVKILEIPTVYARFGDLFAFACIAGLAILLLATIRKEKKQHDRGYSGKNLRTKRKNQKAWRLSLT